jgi:hypothetical protein
MSNLKSRPLNPPAHTYRPQVIPRGCVVNAAIVLLWLLALILLAVSTFGNYVLFVGGWDSAAWPSDAATYRALGLAVTFQAICSVAQWGFKAIRLWLAYAVALLISAIPSFLAYNAIVGPWIEPQIGPWIAPVVIFLSALFIDMLPEWILVR